MRRQVVAAADGGGESGFTFLHNLLCFSLRLVQLSVGAFLGIWQGRIGSVIPYIEQRLDACGVLGRLDQMSAYVLSTHAFISLFETEI